MRAVLLVLVTGCSFGLTQSPEPRRPCPTSDIAPTIDTAAAVGLFATSIYLVVRGGEDYAQSNDASYATVAGLGAGLFAIGATRGFSNVRACRDHAVELAFDERHAKRNANTPNPHEQAWALTKQAAASARLGDCDAVVGVDRALRTLDPDFHGTVFARDVAIMRCLTKPAAAPASSEPAPAPSQPAPSEPAPIELAPAPAPAP